MQAPSNRAVELGDGHGMLGLMLLELCKGPFQHGQSLIVLAHVLLADAKVPMILATRHAALEVHRLQEPSLGPLVLLELVVDSAEVDEGGGVRRRLVCQLLQQLSGVGLAVLLAPERGHVLYALDVPRHAPPAALADTAAEDRIRLVQLIALHACQCKVKRRGKQLGVSQPLRSFREHLLELFPEAAQHALVLLLPIVELVLGPHKVLLPEFSVLALFVVTGPRLRGYQVPPTNCLLERIVHRGSRICLRCHCRLHHGWPRRCFNLRARPCTRA
mmetsp:Transcript_672/g.2118  ORF Transcript_672/g.2118 Transcript_672/m.2118 type:complete len:274 (+) Transcript_672:683-1504(+)